MVRCQCEVRINGKICDCPNDARGGYNSENVHVCPECEMKMKKGLGCFHLGKHDIKGKREETVKRMVENWNTTVESYLTPYELFIECFRSITEWIRNSSSH